MIRKGDKVTIKSEWRDPGDEEFAWVACDDEEKGRVTIAPVNTGLAILPRQTVSVEMLMTNTGSQRWIPPPVTSECNPNANGGIRSLD